MGTAPIYIAASRITTNIAAGLRSLGPVWAAFIGSLLLSGIAISTAIAPNRDGILYLEAAAAFQERGLTGALQIFDWIFLPIAIAVVSAITRLPLEESGYLLSILLLAGASATLVACVKLTAPRLAWPACIVILSLPGINNYHDHIIREFGAWYGLSLALWLLLRWARTPGWGLGFAAQLAICFAGLFRAESLVFLLVPLAWQLPRLRTPTEGIRRLAMLAGLPLAAVTGIGLLWGSGSLEAHHRLMQFVSASLPGQTVLFDQTAQRLADAMQHPVGAGQADEVLFYGLLGLVLVKFIGNLGPFVVPLAFAFADRSTWRAAWPGLFRWFFLAYAGVLLVFLYDALFMTSRYVALLNLLVAPLVAVGLARMLTELPRLRWVILGLVVVTAGDNVVSTSPAKTHYLAAAAWVEQHGLEQHRLYFERPEIAYLAGLSYTDALRQGHLSRGQITAMLTKGEIDYALLRSPHNQVADLQQWVSRDGLRLVASFADGGSRRILVIGNDIDARPAPQDAETAVRSGGRP